MDVKPKSLLKRVLKFAREELDRRSRAQEMLASEPSTPALARGGEVKSTRAPARGSEMIWRALEHEPSRAPSLISEESPSEPEVHGLEVLRSHVGEALTLRWSVTPAEVARAKALIDGNPVLCVRLVSFTKARDNVRREVQDRPGVELAGECQIGEPPQRAVISLGLRAGERFVSIAHHVL